MEYSLLAFAVTAACTSAHVYANTSEFIDSASTEVITVIGSSLNDDVKEIEREAVTAATNIDADFGDQLALLPGVSISRNGPVTGLIQYRGLFGNRVGVSIDGVDITGAGPNSCLLYTSPSPRD